MANLIKEYWTDFIEEKLFQDNRFMDYSMDHGSLIENGIVHIYNAGSAGSITMNRNIIPIPVVQRADTNKDYTIDQFSTQAFVITNLESYQLNVDKMKSLIYNETKNLGQVIAHKCLYNWASTVPTANKFYTSGSAVAGLAPSWGTGNRNNILLSDLAVMKNVMDNDNVPVENRKGLVPSSLFNIGILSLSNIIVNANYDWNKAIVPTGGVMPIFGFEIMYRPQVLYTDTNGVLLTLDQNGKPSVQTATDCQAAIFWHPDFVARANGGIDAYYQEKNPVYQGDILSFVKWHGSTAMRTDFIGAYMLIVK
jgi:hypothetical protein